MLQPRLFLLQESSKNNSHNLPDWLELPPLGITEISGEAGTGKTQLGLSLCVSCTSLRYSAKQQTATHSKKRQLEEQNYYKAIYISMRGNGATTSQIAYRLQQMAQQRVASRMSTDESPTAKIKQRKYAQQESKRILQRIWTRSISNIEMFHDFLFHELPQLLVQQEEKEEGKYVDDNDRFGVLVFDSIAGLYRTNGDDNDDEKVGRGKKGRISAGEYYTRRSQDLFSIAAKLKYISDRFNVGVVVLNQVTTVLTNNSATGRVIPALGLAWSNCVNNRFMLSRGEEEDLMHRILSSDGRGVTNNNSRIRFTRKIRVYCSSRFSTTMEARFKIDRCGLVLTS